MTRYETLKTKSDKCKLNAMKSESLWAFNFWSKLSSLLLEDAMKEQINKQGD